MQDLLAHDDFGAGKVTTRWVETNFNWGLPTEPLLESVVAVSIAEMKAPASEQKRPGSNEPDPYNPWKSMNGFRN
jgi:hypothetical protein